MPISNGDIKKTKLTSSLNNIFSNNKKLSNNPIEDKLAKEFPVWEEPNLNKF